MILLSVWKECRCIRVLFRLLNQLMLLGTASLPSPLVVRFHVFVCVIWGKRCVCGGFQMWLEGGKWFESVLHKNYFRALWNIQLFLGDHYKSGCCRQRKAEDFPLPWFVCATWLWSLPFQLMQGMLNRRSNVLHILMLCPWIWLLLMLLCFMIMENYNIINWFGYFLICKDNLVCLDMVLPFLFILEK